MCARRESPIAVARRIAPLLLIVLGAYVLFKDAILARQLYFQDDTITYYLPLAERIDALLLLGRLPLWTPYIFAGHPIFADSETAMLYPPNLLAWLFLDPIAAMIVTRVIRFILGGSFTYLFGRALGMSRPASTLAGLSFAFGSFLVGQIHHKNLADAAVWLPLILCCLERGYRAEGRARPRWWLLGGGAFGVQLLTIHVNPILMTGMMVGAYALVRAGSVRAFVGSLSLVGAVGVGLAAVQLLPLGELASQTFRGRPVEWAFATAFAPPPQNLVTLLFPYFFRDPAGAYWSPWFRWNTTIYVGVAPLLLAIAAVALAPRRREVRFFAGAFLVALDLAMGDRAPIDLYWLVWQLPVVSSTRVPGRYLFLALFTLAILAGLGLDALARALQERRRRVSLLLHGLTATAVGLLAAFLLVGRWAAVNPDAARGWLDFAYLRLPGRNMEFRQVADPLAALLTSLDPIAGWSARGFAALGIALALLWLWRFVPRARAVAIAGILLLTAADLLLFARDFHPRLPAEVVAARGPAATFLAEHNGMHRVLTAQPVWETIPNRLVPLEIQEAGGYSSLLPDRHRAYLEAALRFDNRLLDVMGVRYLAVRRSAPPRELPPGTPVFQDGEVDVYERSTALPKAWLADRPIVANSPAEALLALQRSGFDPLRQVVLEGVAAFSSDEVSDSPGRAEVARYEGETVRLQVDAARASYLVLADTYYPGWVARVDGVERPIMRADYMFRAVAVPAGQHVVEFRYEPLSIRLGAAISLISLLALLGGLAATVASPAWLRSRSAAPAFEPAGT